MLIMANPLLAHPETENKRKKDCIKYKIECYSQKEQNTGKCKKEELKEILLEEQK